MRKIDFARSALVQLVGAVVIRSVLAGCGDRSATGLVRAGVLQELRIGREKLLVHAYLLTLLTRDSNDIGSYHTPRASAASHSITP